jgi:CubicO group peptidase (beta-lactamase class C family)
MKREKGDWATGFMMPTKGSASCGPRFDLSSVGHTGFTGTSLWFDPKNDRLISILSNRVCPSRKNTRFLELRPALHTMAVDSL